MSGKDASEQYSYITAHLSMKTTLTSTQKSFGGPTARLEGKGNARITCPPGLEAVDPSLQRENKEQASTRFDTLP
jgi:hypothetical protein